VSLIESVVALVEDERRKQDFSRVRTIRLAVGALGHAESSALRFCFDAVTRGTIADGPGWNRTGPGQGWCGSCRQSVSLSERFAACPVCGGTQVKMTDGGEIRLSELEVE